jgi:Malonate decarboxylase gamma subunit (MdcE).
MNQTVTQPQVDWRSLAQDLFPQGHAITEQDHFLSGTAQVDGRTVTVVGTTGHTPIGIEIALAQASAILQTVREHPGRPIVILVDTQGQRLRHRDEMLGINSYMAHLGKCVELARRQGHRVVGLVYDQALSGGFITSGPDRRCLLCLAGGDHSRHGPASDGPHYQGAGRTADRAGQEQSGVCPRT